MITKIDRELAEQIVNTIKDVCDHDINFIAPSGIILASTDSSRVGTFHEIGQQVAASGSVLEVTEDNNFSGTKQGINLPLYHNEHLLAVIGITGIPDKVRSYAYLAERITNLLIREQELNQYSRRQADKKHFVIQSLIRNETDNQEYLTSCLHEFKIDLNTKKRIVLIRTNKQNPITNRSILEQKIQQMFAQAHVCLHTFNYPGDFIALIEETDFEKVEANIGTHCQIDDVPTEESDEENPEIVNEEEPHCDVVILTKSGRYTYFGNLDENNCRTGRGRTVSPDGMTSYDGEYLDDRRNGFGVCYYNNGSINYVGNWTDNSRNGGGVGYRLSDGTMHAGKWDNNTPDGYGARFDRNGNLIDVSNYENGVRTGKSVSFDENGNIVVSVYENGEKISEFLVDAEV